MNLQGRLGLGNGPVNKRLNHGGDVDHGSGYGRALAEVYTVPVLLVIAALRIADADIIFSSCGFFLLFSSPNLSRRRSDVYHTSTHYVALVRL